MNQSVTGTQMLRNLSAALREQNRPSENTGKLPTASDWDILKAMLGKRWGVRTVEARETRKAG